jgi:TonB family protein
MGSRSNATTPTGFHARDIPTPRRVKNRARSGTLSPSVPCAARVASTITRRRSRVMSQSAVASFTLFFSSLLYPAAAAPQPSLTILPEALLRQWVKKSVMPGYPRQAKGRGVSGVAVAELKLDGRGALTSVTVLQAPDSSTTRAVEEAVRRWVFSVPPSESASSQGFVGKLTFYFVIDGKGAYVRNPKRYGG